MKLPIRASLAFKQFRTSEKPGFGNNAITALTAAAATFPNLPVALTALRTINTDLAAAISAALTGSHQAVADLKAKIQAWNDAFSKTANYVSIIANGSDVTVRLSGFTPTKGESSPIQKPGVADTFNATINGSKGAIIAGAKTGVADAKAYVFVAAPEGVTASYNGDTMIITVGDKNVYIIADTAKETEFNNLPSGVVFNVSMYAINSAGSGPATAAKQVITQ